MASYNSKRRTAAEPTYREATRFRRQVASQSAQVNDDDDCTTTPTVATPVADALYDTDVLSYSLSSVGRHVMSVAAVG